MKFTPTKIPDVIVVEPDVFGDERGFFMEIYHREKFKRNGLDVVFVQDNHARSIKNVLRGLHYQRKFPQGKLVRVIAGEVFDVAVDIRKNSKYFGQWVGEVLTAENRKQLYVPPGFAHGYCVLSEIAEFDYKCTELYHPEDEAGIIWNDPEIDIKWPCSNPILSDKDKLQPLLKNAIL